MCIGAFHQLFQNLVVFSHFSARLLKQVRACAALFSRSFLHSGSSSFEDSLLHTPSTFRTCRMCRTSSGKPRERDECAFLELITFLVRLFVQCSVYAKRIKSRDWGEDWEVLKVSRFCFVFEIDLFQTELSKVAYIEFISNDLLFWWSTSDKLDDF